MSPLDLLHAAYDPLIAFADELTEAGDEEVGWQPTELPGWTVRDLLFHLASDCQRALVALGTPADGPPDTDEVSYWSQWQPGTEGAQAGLRGTRIIASAWSSVRGPAGLYAETARAVLELTGRADLGQVVSTQGRTLTLESLVRTLVVEAGVHTLDLGGRSGAGALPDLGAAPSGPVLEEVCRVVDGLLGSRASQDFEPVRYVLVGTGRSPLVAEERERLGGHADRFPVFG